MCVEAERERKIWVLGEDVCGKDITCVAARDRCAVIEGRGAAGVEVTEKLSILFF